MSTISKSKIGLPFQKHKTFENNNSPKPVKKISEILSQCDMYRENGVQVIESGNKVVFYCTLCQSWAHNDHTLAEHLKGKKHAYNFSQKKGVIPAVKTFVESVTKKASWFFKCIEPSIPEWMQYWPSDAVSRKNTKSKPKIHRAVAEKTDCTRSKPAKVSINSVNAPTACPQMVDSSFSNPTDTILSSVLNSDQDMENNNNNNITVVASVSNDDAPIPEIFVPSSALVLFEYNEKLGREQGQLMPNSKNCYSMKFSDSPYSIPIQPDPVSFPGPTTACTRKSLSKNLKSHKDGARVASKNACSESAAKESELCGSSNAHFIESSAVSGSSELVCVINNKNNKNNKNNRNNKNSSSSNSNSNNSNKKSSKAPVIGRKGFVKEMEMKMKVFHQGLYKRRRVNERVCFICQQKLENGSQVATILNLHTGEFACSSRNRFGMFHVFHSLCIGNWIIFSLTKYFSENEHMFCRSKAHDDNDGDDCVEMIENSTETKFEIPESGKYVFCPECQGTGFVSSMENLERPRFQLTDVYDQIFGMIKSQSAHATSDLEKHNLPKAKSCCTLCFTNSAQQHIAKMISSNLKWFWFGSPDFESVMSITRQKYSSNVSNHQLDNEVVMQG